MNKKILKSLILELTVEILGVIIIKYMFGIEKKIS